MKRIFRVMKLIWPGFCRKFLIPFIYLVVFFMFSFSNNLLWRSLSLITGRAVAPPLLLLLFAAA